MPRIKFQTLTEQMFYILLVLRSECYGMDIMEKVAALTDGRVRVGAGTLYNLLEQFADEGMIRQTRADGRRRCYVLTEKGEQALEREHERLCRLVADFDNCMRGEKR